MLVDKPLCLNGEEGERMLAVARAHPEQVPLTYELVTGLRAFRVAGAHATVCCCRCPSSTMSCGSPPCCSRRGGS